MRHIPGCESEAESLLVITKFRAAKLKQDGVLTSEQFDYLTEFYQAIHWALKVEARAKTPGDN